MLIEDGYTEEIGGFMVRRFLASERKKFNELISRDTEPAEAAARELLARHISDPEGRRVSLSVVPETVAEAAFANPTEREDAGNLRSGMRLMLKNPLLAIRTCEVCQKWWFDEETGKVIQIGGQYLTRPEHAETKCRVAAEGCEKGTPEHQLSFSQRNQQAFEHWMQWRAVGCPNPHDAIVRRNWMWFESMERHYGLRKIQAVRR